MRRSCFLLLTGSIAGVLACSESLPTAPSKRTAGASTEVDRAPIVRSGARPRNGGEVSPRGVLPLQPGVWGSEGASLTIEGSKARLEILALTLPTGGCFGTYGDIDQAIPNGRFVLPGTYTQLMGVYPGRVQYAAVYTGSVQGSEMSIAVAVSGLPMTVGPFRLTNGVRSAWSPCAYP